VRMKFEDGQLVAKPVGGDWQEKYVRKYSDKEIEEFLEADRWTSKELRAARQ